MAASASVEKLGPVFKPGKTNNARYVVINKSYIYSP
jgi:hypothetical protein